ncbi:putative toxin-antitoxin system toxin component, PIN family [Wenzhouxiangella sp. XN79A]|uniref:putative toxin-antitoxin system toxin component, PIN family n=1 Tax=Wenzhouxiangella sp. XN79A TaxID=2724193 RepID=UPI0023F6AC3B|nr:putative toxin-antitoxin system toxin component, PIN family [Wenzhouxiangella sp. XN79A]
MIVERVVLDTNVLISAVLSPSGAPANLLARLVRARSVLVFSEPTMNELATRMLKSKFDRYVDRSLRVKFLAELDAIAEIVGITGAPMGCRDRDDDMILETALNAEAPLIVTGDADLLSMNPWRDIRIISPAEAIEFF